MPRKDENSSDGKARERRQAADREALQAGRLPSSAVERLQQQQSSGNKMFSSDLSTREFLLLQNSQVRPLGQVMGTAFMSIPSDQAAVKKEAGNVLSSFFGQGSNQNMGSNYAYGSSNYSSQPFSGELTDLTRGRLEVRRSAFSRMEMEAGILGASGIVGVRTTTKVHDWGGKTIEFTVFGTAVHVPTYEGESLFTSLLSGQEFWQLWNAGYEPRGVAIGVCSYSDCTDWSSIHDRNYNQEVMAYTQCFYEAREIAMRRVVADLKRKHARGAVGMKIEYEFEEAESEFEVNESTSLKYLHLITHLVVMGTAIARRKVATTDTRKRSTMLVYDLKKPGSASVEFKSKNRKDARKE